MWGVRTTLLQAARGWLLPGIKIKIKIKGVALACNKDKDKERGWLLPKGSGVITSSPAPPIFPAFNKDCNDVDIDDGVDDDD